MGRPLIVMPPWHTVWAVLNVVLPGVGAIIVGARNPHSRLLRDGLLQLSLVVFGAWPLIIPAVIGFAWAVWTAVRIQREAMPPAAWSRPVDVPD